MHDFYLQGLCWPWWRHGLLMFVIVCLMLVIGCICSHDILTYLRLKSDAVLINTKHKTLQLSQLKMVKLKADVQHLDMELDAAVNQLDLHDSPSFTHAVDALAVQHALQIKGWRTLPDNNLLQLSAQGNYTEFVSFLQALLLLPQVLSVHDVKIERMKAANALSLSVTLNIYRLRHFSLKTSANQRLDLDFLGLLQQGQRVWGIICLPGGHIMHVQVGDSVGNRSESVTRINEHALWIGKNQHFVLHSTHNGCRGRFDGSVI